jgi:hypothetical protein
MEVIDPWQSLFRALPAGGANKFPTTAPPAFRRSAAAEHVDSNACIQLEGGALSTSRASKPHKLSRTSDPTGTHSQQQRYMGAAAARAQVRPSGAPAAVRPAPARPRPPSAAAAAAAAVAAAWSVNVKTTTPSQQ